MEYDINIDKLEFVHPYSFNGHKKANISYKYGTKAGVYFIKENGQLIYVGCSTTRLYYVLYRHFQTWNDGRGYERTTYVNLLKKHLYEIAILETKSEDAHDIETAFIKKYKPRDNKYKLNHIEFEEWWNIERWKFMPEPSLITFD